MNLNDEYRVHMQVFSPEIGELPGDLKMIATVIEDHAPGWGVKMTVHLAKQFKGLKVYWPSLDGLPAAVLAYAKSRKPIQQNDILSVSVMDLTTAHLRVVATEAMQLSPIGMKIILRLNWAYRGQETLLHTVEWMLDKHRREWVEHKYGTDGVTAWELAHACGLSQSTIEKIGGGGYDDRKKDKRQKTIWDLV